MKDGIELRQLSNVHEKYYHYNKLKYVLVYLWFSQAVFYKKFLSQSLYWLQNKEPLSNQMCVHFNK